MVSQIEDYKDFIIGFTIDEIKRCINVSVLEDTFDIELYNSVVRKVHSDSVYGVISKRGITDYIKASMIKCKSEQHYICIAENLYESNNLELKNIISLYKENKLIKNNLSTYIINNINGYNIIELLTSLI